MKKTTIIFLLSIISSASTEAVTTESHTLDFSESDYTFSYDGNGSLVIGTVDGDASYPSPDEPGLLFYGNVIIPFIDHFPKDTHLYHLLTTRPEDLAEDGK